MKLLVVEPAYFPIVAVCSKIAAADKIIYADTFKYKTHSFINRTPVKTRQGKTWLTIPVYNKGKKHLPINKMTMAHQSHWQNSHLKTLEINYRHSPYFYYYIDEIKSLLNQSSSLHQLLLQTISFSLGALHLSPERIKASDISAVQNRTQRVIRWLKESGCHTYLLEPHEKELIDLHTIKDKGFDIYTLEPYLRPYHQQYNGFVENCSVLDLLFNEGDLSRSIIQSCKTKKI